MSGQTVILRGDVQRQLACSLIAKAPADAVVNIRESARTQGQNDRMWAMLSDIARQKPEGRNWKTEQWKAAFMDACGHKPTYAPTLEGDGFICLGYRSSRLTVRQMTDLIECMFAYGATHGVRWSDAARTKEAA